MKCIELNFASKHDTCNDNVYNYKSRKDSELKNIHCREWHACI